MMRLASTGVVAACATVLVSSSHVVGDQEGDPAAERPWTLLVYGAADNNADGPILDFLDGVRAALDDDPGMELVLFLDRSRGHSEDARSLGADFTGARIYRLRSDSAELLDATELFPEMVPGEECELDSADPEVLARFIAFGKARFPAKHTGLMIYSHADGCTMCPDEESGTSMGIPALTDWIPEESSVDFLALELCNMGGIEVAYQWRPGQGAFSADVLVAIPNAGPPLDWARAFARIRSKGHPAQGHPANGHPANGHPGESGAPTLDPATMTPEDFGRLVVEEGYRGRMAMAERHPEEAEQIGYEAAGCYDLRVAGKVKRAVDRLAVALAAAEAKDTFERLRDEGMNYVRGRLGTRPYVDLHDLCRRAAGCDELPPAVRDAARAVCEATDELVLASFGMDRLAGFEPGRNGIFIAFPDGDAEVAGPFGKRRVWDAMGWYTPLEPADPGAGPYGRWAFLADGATPGNGQVENWFELLELWFDGGEAGGANRYTF